MGWIARVLSSARRTVNGTPTVDVKSDPGGGANVTPSLYLPPGDDARPLAGDYEYLGATPRTGGWATLGFQDAINAGVTAPGEKRIYARDASGTVVAQVYLNNAGALVLSNDTATVTIAAGGSITANDGETTWTMDGAGGATLDNGSGAIELQDDGTVDINGVQIDAAANITGVTTLTASGNVTAADFVAGVITLLQHKHNGVTPGTGTSGTPVP